MASVLSGLVVPDGCSFPHKWGAWKVSLLSQQAAHWTRSTVARYCARFSNLHFQGLVKR